MNKLFLTLILFLFTVSTVGQNVTDHLGMPLFNPRQSQPHVKHNEALRIIDAVLGTGAVSKTVELQPSSPSEGQVYLLPANATGPSEVWTATNAMKMAHYYAGSWHVYEPTTGWRINVNDEDTEYRYTGELWQRQSKVTGALAEATTGADLRLYGDLYVYQQDVDSNIPTESSTQTIVLKQLDTGGLIRVFDRDGNFNSEISGRTDVTSRLGETLIVNTSASIDPTASFQVDSTDTGTLLQRLTTAQRDAIVTPADFLLIVNTDTQAFEFAVGGTWIQLATQ